MGILSPSTSRGCVRNWLALLSSRILRTCTPSMMAHVATRSSTALLQRGIQRRVEHRTQVCDDRTDSVSARWARGFTGNIIPPAILLRRFYVPNLRRARQKENKLIDKRYAYPTTARNSETCVYSYLDGVAWLRKEKPRLVNTPPPPLTKKRLCLAFCHVSNQCMVNEQRTSQQSARRKIRV